MKENEEFLKMLGATGTKKILEFLDTHKKGQYKEMAEFMSVHSLNIRLRDLLSFGLICRYLEREPKKTEWYSLTQKGKQVLYYLRCLVGSIGESS